MLCFLSCCDTQLFAYRIVSCDNVFIQEFIDFSNNRSAMTLTMNLRQVAKKDPLYESDMKYYLADK